MSTHHSTVEVLGCSGSIGIRGEGTTSFLIDDDLLIDAGSGLNDLEFSRLERINHLVLTHSHLDHICSLPFLVDTVGVSRKQILRIYGLKHTIEALKECIFNERIWPDFTKIPNKENPVMEYVVIEPHSTLQFGDRTVHTIPVTHTVPAIGVILDTPTGSWCFSGDTHQTDELYQALNVRPNLKYFFLEAAFPDKEKWLADLAKHLCPSLVFGELGKLHSNCEVWISHLKPREFRQIQSELLGHGSPRPLQLLAARMIFHI
jgi:cAMP phosphodiesterase